MAFTGTGKIWMNGSLVEWADARIHIASHVIHYGSAVFEGARCYQTPAPADLERLMRGELVSPPRLRNGRIPQRLNDIILKAMAPDVSERYQRASDVLEDLLAAERTAPKRTTDRPAAAQTTEPAPAQAAWSKPRESPQPRFCWKCNKPLHARTDRCPFCGEAQ